MQILSGSFMHIIISLHY